MTKTLWREHRRDPHLIKTPPTEDMVISDASTIIQDRPGEEGDDDNEQRENANQLQQPPEVIIPLCI
ncbi:unnamed protein product [Cylicostephanus goldi]|uniref:Uncharacterized protein n=1 Tax=Cylicostephanus goldi TaxID=71465 RepID=A0A3P7MJ60_CYLGO|nr:unnamed protein product [Cylicostephanus goldi]